MSARHTLTPAELGIEAAPGPIDCPVIVSKRKKPGGGFLPQKPRDRFWFVAPHQNEQKVRPPLPQFKRFNDCEIAGIVDNLPMELGAVRREDCVDLSRTLYRWSVAEFGKVPEIYQAPESARPWCSTFGLDHQGGPMRRRLAKTGDEWGWEEAACPGDRCEFSSSMAKGKRSPCVKKLTLTAWPRWDALAARIREDKSDAAADLAESILRLPKTPARLSMGGEFAPSAKNFEKFMLFIQQQAEALGVWPCSLIGLPFSIRVTRHAGRRQYTVYEFIPDGNIRDWMLGQVAAMKELQEGRRVLLLSAYPGDEDGVVAHASDVVDLQPEEVAVRPAQVADVKPVKEKAETDDPDSEPIGNVGYAELKKYRSKIAAKLRESGVERVDYLKDLAERFAPSTKDAPGHEWTRAEARAICQGLDGLVEEVEP